MTIEDERAFEICEQFTDTGVTPQIAFSRLWHVLVAPFGAGYCLAGVRLQHTSKSGFRLSRNLRWVYQKFKNLIFGRFSEIGFSSFFSKFFFSNIFGDAPKYGIENIILSQVVSMSLYVGNSVCILSTVLTHDGHDAQINQVPVPYQPWSSTLSSHTSRIQSAEWHANLPSES